MEYQKFVEAVTALNYIQDRQVSESIVKAVLGILASRMEEHQARILADQLPEPLDYDKLRGHQARISTTTVEQCYTEIGNQFHLDRKQAHEIVDTVLHVLKRDMKDETLDAIEEGLPGDWVEAIERA